MEITIEKSYAFLVLQSIQLMFIVTCVNSTVFKCRITDYYYLCYSYLFSLPTDVVRGIILLHFELCGGTVHWPEGEVSQEKKWISGTGTAPISEVLFLHRIEACVIAK